MENRIPFNEGGFGKVYRPPLPCVGRRFTESHVGKVTDEEYIIQELAASRAIQRYHDWADWACPAIYSCGVTGTSDKQLVYRYCGTPLQNLLVTRGAYDDRMLLDPDSDILSAPGFDQVVRLVIDFLPRIEELNKSYIHGDMHLRNILQKDGSCYLIDFATMVPVKTAIQNSIRKVANRLGMPAAGKVPAKPEYIAAFIESHADEIKAEALNADVEYILNSLVSILESPWGKNHLKKYRFWLASTRAPRGFRQPLVYPQDFFRVLRNLATFI